MSEDNLQQNFTENSTTPQNPENQCNSNQQNTNDENNTTAEQLIIQQLQQQIAEQQQQLEDIKKKWLLSLADLENFRKRAQDEKEKASQFAISGFVGDLVAVVENFFMASANAPKQEIESNQAIKNYATAIEMTEKELLKTLGKHKVERIYPLNDKFNHNLHEALSQIESEQEADTVLQVIQAGYKLADRLIRPALVIVAKAKSDAN
jgi:molecular chaperone GrpE